MCSPNKREDLQHFHKDHGFSKKVLLNCCLVRRVLTWASPNSKGTIDTKNVHPHSAQTHWLLSLALLKYLTVTERK